MKRLFYIHSLHVQENISSFCGCHFWWLWLRDNWDIEPGRLQAIYIVGSLILLLQQPTDLGSGQGSLLANPANSMCNESIKITVSLSGSTDKNIELFHDFHIFWDVPLHVISLSYREEKIVFLVRKMFLLFESINKLFLFKFNNNNKKPHMVFFPSNTVCAVFIHSSLQAGTYGRKIMRPFIFFLTCQDTYLSAHSAARRQKGLNVCFMGQKVLTVFAERWSSTQKKKNSPIKIQTYLTSKSANLPCYITSGMHTEVTPFLSSYLMKLKRWYNSSFSSLIHNYIDPDLYKKKGKNSKYDKKKMI